MQRALLGLALIGSVGCTATTTDGDTGTDANGRDVGSSMDANVDAASCGANRDADGDHSIAVACGGVDCDDADPNAFAGNPEVCDVGGHDEDCDPSTYGFRDTDGDGHVDAACCNTDAAGTHHCGDDCNDMRNTAYPGDTEACDGFDNDCDGAIDEGVLITFYRDADLDLFGDASATDTMQACSAPTGYTLEHTDCDDAHQMVHPGAVAACDCSASHPYDIDGDGYATPSCGGEDCNDQNAAIHPGALDTCNGVDDDCSGLPDQDYECVGCDLCVPGGMDGGPLVDAIVELPDAGCQLVTATRGCGRTVACTTSCGTQGFTSCTNTCTLDASCTSHLLYASAQQTHGCGTAGGSGNWCTSGATNCELTRTPVASMSAGTYRALIGFDLTPAAASCVLEAYDTDTSTVLASTPCSYSGLVFTVAGGCTNVEIRVLLGSTADTFCVGTIEVY